MFTLNVGPCYRRSHLVEPLERPDIEDEDLHRIFDFTEFLNRWMGGHRVVLDMLSAASIRWGIGQPISILHVGCQRGDLTRAIINWGRARGFDVRIFAIDKFGRFVQMAKDASAGFPEISYEIRLLSDPLFLQAQQFDYVISSLTLHEQTHDEVIESLKKFNLLARRGIIVMDWIRDFRAWCWMSAFSMLLGNEPVRRQASLSIRKGFTETEINKLCRQAGVEYLNYSKHLGYRFSISGERGLVLSSKFMPLPGLAT